MVPKHWGAVPAIKKDTPVDLSSDIKRSMDKYCLERYENEEIIVGCEDLEVNCADPLVWYGIGLHKYLTCVTQKLDELKIKWKTEQPDDEPPLPKVPEVPTFQRKACTYYRFSLHESDCPVDVPEITKSGARNFLKYSIALMLAHLGYEKATKGIIEILVSILDDFLRKVSHVLKVATDDHEKGMLTGYTHPIERVLHDIGFGGVEEIQEFYHDRIVKYAHVLYKRCYSVYEEHSRFIGYRCPSPEDENTEEILDDSPASKESEVSSSD